MTLQGQVALVTGGGRGIGRAIAIALANEGAAIAVLARSQHEIDQTASEITANGATALAISADVTQRSQVESAVDTVTKQLGPIDILINNAGGGGNSIGPVAEVNPDEWWNTVELNLRSVFLCSHAVLPSMLERKSGRIINISSALALRPGPNGSSYSVSKAAAIRLTDSMAVELAPNGITVFAVSPGLVRTALTDQLTNSEAGQKWLPHMQHIPDNQWTPPEEGAALVAAIASGKADALSGRYLHVTDDLDDLIARADEIRTNDTLTLRLRR